MVSKLYYKNKFIIKLIKPFENKRLFTALKLNILTVKDYNLWPRKLIALDAFCQTGLQWTRIFSDETEYLEMWDINAEAIKYAKKEFPKANVNCGDSVDAIINGKLHRKDFNFVLIDSPVPFMYPDGTFEHFKFFNALFNNIANECVLMFDVVPNIQTMLNIHPHPKEFNDKWIQAREEFYGVKNADIILPNVMLEIYKEKVTAMGYKLNLATYNARNANFGILTLAVSKN